MLEVKNLTVETQGKIVLKGINLSLKPGQVHALIGFNGSGKTSLALALMGHPKYTLQSGEILINKVPIHSLSPDERALKGLFVAFQAPISIPGLSNIQFLKTALNAKRKSQNQPELDTLELLNTVKQYMTTLQLPEQFIERALNDGFSGGEKKRNEILQLLLLKPDIAILDETDSGLDSVGLSALTQIVQQQKEAGKAFLIITHYGQMLKQITPDYIHFIHQGQITESKSFDIKDLERLTEPKAKV
jgi:Fe-S cluster assembly ATP-binding protein